MGTQLLKNDAEFERAISIRLVAHGFHALPIGDAEGVDHVASLPAGGVPLLISCTIASNIRDKGKIGGMMAQRNRLNANLEFSQVRCTLAVPLPEADMLLGDARDCAENDIGLLLREDLRRIYDVVTGPNRKQGLELFLSIVEGNRKTLR